MMPKDWPRLPNPDLIDETIKEGIENLIKVYGIKKVKPKTKKRKDMPLPQSDEEINKLIKHMLDAVINEGKDLSDWERDFTESISDQFTRKGSLSPKQRDILERIYTEKVD